MRPNEKFLGWKLLVESNKSSYYLKNTFLPTVKHDCGSVMFCFYSVGTEKCIKLGAEYKAILEETIFQCTGCSWLEWRLIYQQDSNPKHTVQATLNVNAINFQFFSEKIHFHHLHQKGPVSEFELPQRDINIHFPKPPILTLGTFQCELISDNY